MNFHLGDIALIIPVAPQERAWLDLIPDLEELPADTEIIFVSPETPPEALRESSLRKLSVGRKLRWVTTAGGVAAQLNFAAARTEKKLLWILHADSRFEPEALDALEESLTADGTAIHYFDLIYEDPLQDVPSGMLVNWMGTWLRSHWFKLPMGNQGLCIPRAHWQTLGGFDESQSRLVEASFVIAAREHGIPIRCVGHNLSTSPRRYLELGWIRGSTQDVREMLTLARRSLGKRRRPPGRGP